MRRHVAVGLAVLALGACTSSNDTAANPATGARSPSTVLRSTTTTIVVPVPLPADPKELEVGQTYVFELTAHCDFRSLNGEIAGSGWFATTQYDALDLEEWLDGDEAWGSEGLIGELHYLSTEEMVFAVPGSRLRIEYAPTEQATVCF